MNVFLLCLLTIFVLLVSCVYYWVKRRYHYWETRRVPHLKAQNLFFGNEYELFTGKCSMAEMVKKHYDNLAPHKYGGVHSFHKSVLVVRDPELIKSILIKDFHHFHDRNFFLASKSDPLSMHLFNLTGEEWKILRSKLTPTFTSGKMKVLFELMKECAEKLNEIIEKSVAEGGAIEMSGLMARFATDVISSCAFGLEADSLHNAHSIFRHMGQQKFIPNWRTRIRLSMLSICPRLISFLRYKEVPQDVSDFFVNLLNDTIQYRKQNGVVRHDFLSLLMAIQNDQTEDSKQFDFNVEVLAAQCFIFLVAGFETTSTTLALLLYELSEHLDVQEKLQAEVDEVLGKNGGQITYDCFQEMHYLEKVINETLRLFPPSSRLLRVCTADYRIPDSDYVVEKGQELIIPSSGIMKDPQYYPDPEVFDPENFSKEAILSRSDCCFLPFGTGPRICIGMRFALMEIKLAVAGIMKEYSVSGSPEMELPIRFTPYIPLSTLDSNILLHFSKRKVKDQE